jgi:hypothetical protein
MKRLVVILGIICVQAYMLATPVAQNIVLTVAENWLEMQSNQSYSVCNFEVESDSLSNPLLYKINFNPSGFVIIPADDRCYPILSYSESGEYFTASPAKLDLINQYKTAIQSVIEDNLSNEITLPKWAAILSRNIGTGTEHVIPGFLDEWNQQSPYNDLCPILFHPPSTQRSLVGCVATAFSQIINYWGKWRYEFSDNDDYSLEFYYNYNHPRIDDDCEGSEDHDFGFPSFPILNTYMNQVVDKYISDQELSSNDLSALCFASGVLLKMQYNTPDQGSSAHTYEEGSPAYDKLNYAHTPLKKSGNPNSPEDYTEEEWDGFIQSSIDNDYPVHYGALYQGSASGGHSFILYGYRVNNGISSYAINWGDSEPGLPAWWSLSNLNPYQIPLNDSHEMQCNIHPIAQVQQTISLEGGGDPSFITVVITNSEDNSLVGSYHPESSGYLDISFDLAPHGKNNVSILKEGYQTINYSDCYFMPGVNILDESDIELPRLYYIHGSVSCNEPQFDLSLVNVNLMNSANDIVGSTTPDAAGNFTLATIAGQYYVECELFQPSLGRYYYPVVSDDLNLSGNDIAHSLPPICLTTPYSLSTVRVSSGELSPYFRTIGQALERIQTAVNGGYNGIMVTMDILPGNYYWPLINSQHESSFNYTNVAHNSLVLLIRGAGTGALIEPQYDGLYTLITYRTNVRFQNIKFSRSTQNWDYHLSFQGTNGSSYSFTGCVLGNQNTSMNYKSSTSFSNQTGITMTNCSIINNDNTTDGNGVVKFVNCTNIDLNSCNFSDNASFHGGAIYCSQSNNLQVRNSLFEYNFSCAPSSEIPSGTPGGAMYLESSTNVNINGNRFLHNTTTGTGGVVFINSVSNFSISGNLFRDNTLQHVGLINPQSDALGFDNCSFTASDYISNNIIHSGFELSPGSQSDFIVLNSNCTGTLDITNGVFKKGIFDNNSEKRIVCSFAPVNMNITNCVFQTRDVNANFCNSTYPPQPTVVNLTYSLFDNDFNGVTNGNHNSSHISDMKLDSDYIPIWNHTTMSPCIDAGYGVSDPDGTPPDIGAKRAIAHNYWEYTFTTQADLERWYWVSYPVLNSVTDDMLVANEFFKELLEVHTVLVNGLPQNLPTYLDQIDWKEVGAENSIIWSEQTSNWTSNEYSHFVSSPQGYKVKLHQLASGLTTVKLRESGFRTPSDTQFPIYGGDVENWLGYFRADPAWPHEVFASIWDDINMIKTKNWCLVRANPLGDYWGMHGKVSTLKDGDMVIVTTNNNHTFQWNNTDATPPDYKASPEHFIFNEKQDYVPIYISLPDSLVLYPKEVGFYLDGICKGAVVIEKNIEQICAYLDLDDDLSHGLIEFIFYYNDDKSQQEERKVVRLDNGRMQAQYANGNVKYPYCDITFSNEDMESAITPVLNLDQNYPNPFNPSTTISYQLPVSGNVRLDVFNIRGQLVRTLINSEQEAGDHRVVWNGADASGKSVGSGLYIYRLCSPAGTLSKRMLLMK